MASQKWRQAVGWGFLFFPRLSLTSKQLKTILVEGDQNKKILAFNFSYSTHFGHKLFSLELMLTCQIVTCYANAWLLNCRVDFFSSILSTEQNINRFSRKKGGRPVHSSQPFQKLLEHDCHWCGTICLRVPDYLHQLRVPLSHCCYLTAVMYGT